MQGKWAVLFDAITLQLDHRGLRKPKAVLQASHSKDHTFVPGETRDWISPLDRHCTYLRHYKKIHSTELILTVLHSYFKNHIWYKINRKKKSWEDILQWEQQHYQLLLWKPDKRSGLVFSLIVCSFRLNIYITILSLGKKKKKQTTFSLCLYLIILEVDPYTENYKTNERN